MITLFVVVGGAYLLGSIPTAYWATKAWKGVDIREVGSGNVGATNAARVLGRRGGALVLAADLSKGALAVWAATRLPLREVFVLPPEILSALAAAAVVGGHVWSVFLGGRAGKGVATAAGAFGALDPLATLIAAAAFAGCLSVGRIVSLASLAAAWTLPAAAWAMGRPGSERALAAALAVLVTWTHRENLGRLVRGQEPRW